MPEGPGKYDHLCTMVREAARAEGALVIVLGGYLGSGFSVQIPQGERKAMAEALCAILRSTADQIEDSQKGVKGNE